MVRLAHISTQFNRETVIRWKVRCVGVGEGKSGEEGSGRARESERGRARGRASERAIKKERGERESGRGV